MRGFTRPAKPPASARRHAWLRSLEGTFLGGCLFSGRALPAAPQRKRRDNATQSMIGPD